MIRGKAAATGTPAQQPAPMKRVALVIGNAAYLGSEPSQKYLTKLANPVHDVRALATLLKEHGFEVPDDYDVDHQRFMQLLRRFARATAGTNTALVFYAGHGMVEKDDHVNALAPTNAETDWLEALRAKVDTLVSGETLEVFIKELPDGTLGTTTVRLSGDGSFIEIGACIDQATDRLLRLRSGTHPEEGEISKGKHSEKAASHSAIPTKAPRLWRGARKEVMNAKEFVEQIYTRAIKAGMTQRDLRRLDPKLYMAFHKWCGRNSVDPQAILPSSLTDVDELVARRGRPTRAEAIAALRTGTKEGLEVWRAYEALGRRERMRRGGKPAPH